MIDEGILVSGVERGLKEASYIDIRFEVLEGKSFSSEDGVARGCESTLSQGFGVRALAGGSWGFCSIGFEEGREKELVFKAVDSAVRLAKSSAGHSREVRLFPKDVAVDSFSTRVELDNSRVSDEFKQELCCEASKEMKEVEGVSKSYAGIGEFSLKKLFVDSEGSRIFQSLVFTQAGVTAVAGKGESKEFFSLDEGRQAGFEVVRDWDLVEKGREAARTAVELAGASSIGCEEVHVVLDPDFLGLLVHEIVGHPSEGDRVLGREAAWAGKTWWQDKVGETIGSDLVNVVSDASIEGFYGSFKYDDEGVRGQRVEHLKKGVLKDFLQSRETGALFGKPANGAMRASSYLFAPLIRMTNTFFEKGSSKKEELFEETRNGVYLVGGKVPSIDSRRYNFQISCRAAYRIRDGEIAEPIKGVSLTGVSPVFWKSVDLVASDLVIRPVPNCGKGDPMQTMWVGNGGPHIRGKALVTGLK